MSAKTLQKRFIDRPNDCKNLREIDRFTLTASNFYLEADSNESLDIKILNKMVLMVRIIEFVLSQ
ncbi:hypothetical protein BpHYR1_042195 [Brachionus plicatilis]|uniref:Uncharacterized protein n=1 Tax=Brachionus plicatilis TaxID=10195 RepID=A0A3M7SGL2_BRAPC|nr:hypothetical protein BpHYR1_042195 [Brachionus plicatilis]